jgi:hypothetical protein
MSARGDGPPLSFRSFVLAQAPSLTAASELTRIHYLLYVPAIQSRLENRAIKLFTQMGFNSLRLAHCKS